MNCFPSCRLSSRWFIVAAVFTSLGWVSASKAQAQLLAPTWIAVLGASELKVRVRENMSTLHFPVVLTPDSPSGVSLRTFATSWEGVYDPAVEKAFKVTPELKVTPDAGTVLELKVDWTQAPRAGAYTITIRATAPDAPPAGGAAKGAPRPPVLLSLRVIHPEATLRMPAKLVIERVENPFLEEQPRLRGLTLQETSNLSRLTALSTPWVDLGDVVDTAGKPLIDFKPDADEIAPKGSITVRPTVKDGLPLGTLTATLGIDAPELKAPLTLPVEVRVRQGYWVLLTVILIGIVVGFGVRVLLQRRVDLGEARLKALDAEDRLRQALAQHPDADFAGDVNEALKKLATALNSNAVDSLAAAAITADGALRAALEDLAGRRAEVQASVAEFSSLLNTAWWLPQALEKPLETARKCRDKAQRELRTGDVKTASESLREGVDDLRTQLRAVLPNWRIPLQTRLGVVAGANDLPLPLSIGAGAKEGAARLGALLQQVGEPSPNATVTEMIAVLQKVDAARVNLRDFLREFSERLQLEHDAFVATMPKSEELPDPQALDAFKASFQQFLKELIAAREAPELATALLNKSRLEELDDAWRESLTAQFPNPVPEPLANLIAARRYIEAAEELSELLPRERALDEGVSELAPVAPQPLDWVPGLNVRQPVVPRAPLLLRDAAQPEPLEVRRARTLGELAWARAAQTVFAGIGILFVGYLLHAPKFVGTVPELFSIFMWGFGLDVTVSTFVQAAGRVPPRN